MTIFPFLYDEQRSQKVGIEHRTRFFPRKLKQLMFSVYKGWIDEDYDVIKLMMTWGHPPPSNSNATRSIAFLGESLLKLYLALASWGKGGRVDQEPTGSRKPSNENITYYLDSFR